MKAKVLGYCESNLLAKLKRGGRRNLKVRTMGRGTFITSEFVGYKVWVYNGLAYFVVDITREKVGYRLGDFIFTKKLSDKVHINNRIEVKKRKKQFAIKNSKRRGGKKLFAGKNKGRIKNKK